MFGRCTMISSVFRRPSGDMTIPGPIRTSTGLLIMISTKLVKAEEIQYVALHPGRLLHDRESQEDNRRWTL